MFRNFLMSCALAGVIAAGVASAQVTVRIAPPRARVERRGPPPGRGYVWTPGYHRWDGRAYVWMPGTWVTPPRPRAHWVPPHWVKRHHEWFFVEGHWR